MRFFEFDGIYYIIADAPSRRARNLAPARAVLSDGLADYLGHGSAMSCVLFASAMKGGPSGESRR